MIRMSREPVITRANMSRPSESVPNQCESVGAWLMLLRFCTSGLCGTRRLPKIAARIQKTRIVAPKMNAFE